jgi:hypothetical protein
MWANKSICSYSDFNLAYVAEFQYKAGYAKKKTVGMETLDTHSENVYTIMHESECYFFLHLLHQNSCLVFVKKNIALFSQVE